MLHIPLRFTNTLSRKKESFFPLIKNSIKLYVCGVTPYDHSHIGHGRSYTNFDVLVRFFRFIGYNVTYVRNVTDIDDKLLARAEKEFGDQLKYLELSKKFTNAFQDDVKNLGCLSPDVEPLVTEHIPEIITFIQGLIDQKKAYESDGDVYFDVMSDSSYGKLSGKKVDELQAGARIEINTKKKHPADFVLWKGNDEKLFWESPWGYGRPGWHIECSVLAKKYLGETIDIHGGGSDLIFPHHENECAQSEGLHEKLFARFWLHNALLNLDKEKMSKSLGNIFLLRDMYKKIDPMMLRFYFLQHHYRTPIEFSLEKVEGAGVAYKKLITLFSDTDEKNYSSEQALQEPLCQKIIEALSDDLNTSRAIALLFENTEEIIKSLKTRSCVKMTVQNVLGLTLEKLKEKEITPEIQDLIEKRKQARSEKNWELADILRDQLRDLGYEVSDGKI